MIKNIDVKKLFSIDGFAELSKGVAKNLSVGNIYRIIRSEKPNELFDYIQIDKIKLIYPTEKFWELYDKKSKNKKSNMASTTVSGSDISDTMPFCSTMQNDNQFFEQD